MRIMTVCTCYRVFGAETITLKMLEGFQRNGHEQVAVTSIWTDGDFSRRLKPLGIPEEIMPFGTIAASLSPRLIKWSLDCMVRLPVLWWKWQSLVRRFKPDVIVLTSSRQGLLLLPFLGGTPVYSMEFTNSNPTAVLKRIFSKLAKKFTGFVAVSEYMSTFLPSLGVPAEKIFVVKSGAFFEEDLQRVVGRPDSRRRTGQEPVCVGIVGQVSRNKGHDCLVDAVRLLKDRGHHFMVRTYGSGDPAYMEHLKQKISRAGLAEIWEWMGYEKNKEKIFGSLDICVVPSCFGDPFPTVAMEAAVYGLPVVASRIGGLPEIIDDGTTGWLVPANEPRPLADKLEWLLQHQPESLQMGLAGRDRIFKNFTVEKMVAELERLFETKKVS